MAYLIPRNTAIKLIKKYGTNCPFEIARQKGITIYFESLGGSFGYYACYKRIQSIHINDSINEALQKFVCAHELGHSILHKNENTPFLKRNTFFSTNKIELEANKFAVELLIPDEFIYEFRDTRVTIKEVAQKFGVPEEVCYLKKIDHID
ncbi:ImmA/IrrE family metallo-endopeptidase [Lentibacillus salicampi]|uniref:ImmA/IrrE family metallo-endopeptidase n=1 Tax=Lentibacillus salicampi TaxID=175306 RepID=A0A4Y9AAC0_9BACI|nr:ImmA/IrrE family metallo-endopeptidase [Lentibacillus salicampi]TFJ92839.1 ImmA/IrrE family metallo-endopeptidase [Lentibacillus salicampi]